MQKTWLYTSPVKYVTEISLHSHFKNSRKRNCAYKLVTESKQIFWTVSCIAFFGSFRMGKLLNSTITKVDLYTTLLWKDIKFNGKSWLIHEKAPKTRTQGGEYIDIFPFPNHNCCPVAALKKWNEISIHAKNPSNPVFMMNNGHCLTQKILMTQFVASFALD